MILPQNSSLTPMGQSANIAHFVVFFHKLSEYSNLEITLWGKQGLLVIQKRNIYS
jgi:hypothetical protein